MAETIFLNAASTEFNQTISYFDGLGRPAQQVSVGSGGSAYDQGSQGQDIITIQEYDAFGRQAKKYLPISDATNGGAYRNTILENTINSYYNNSLLRSGAAYGLTQYEASPLNRITGQTAPGSGTVVTINYRANTASDGVKLLTYVFSTSTVNVSTYSAGVLYVTETTNENNHKTSEFKDKEGRIVCRDIAGLRTYYVFDDFNRLRCVLPPKAAGLLASISFNLFDSSNDLIFAYDYDHRGRQIRKKIPGAGITIQGYDLRDRLVSSTDAKGVTVITSYDGLDRVVSTSLSGGQMLTQTYYDNYTFAGSKSFDELHAYGQKRLENLQGMQTGIKVWGLGNASALTQITATYYDELGRVIQTIADNHLGSVDKVSHQLDFVGREMQNKLTTRNNLIIETRQSYDRASRPKAVCQRVTDSQSAADNTAGQYWEPVARYSYNGIGELTRKTLGCNLQQLDYTYLMRGWLNDINKPTNLDQNGEKDLFGMSLAYDNIGNITNWQYRSAQKQGMYAGTAMLAQNPLMDYSFSYDNQNRLKTATLKQNTTTVFNMGGDDTGDKIRYDDNGNIQNLKRWFKNVLVDNLSYTYTTNSNQLSSITDNGEVNKNDGFFNVNTSAYSYDANGNLKSDDGKGIAIATYNHLNLPQNVVNSITGSVSYTYNAVGQKLRASMGTSGKIYDYVSGLLYENNTLEFIPTAEGRILPPGRAVNPTSTTEVITNRFYRYEYQLKDHLGNLRVACRCPEISTAVVGSSLVPGPKDTYPLMVVQEEHYDPWGLSLSGLSTQTMITSNRFKYNGKEDQKGLDWIDYGARMYDPQIGRWNSVDPLAENHYNHSPSIYVLNNPLLYGDAFGLDTIRANTAQTIHQGDVIILDNGSMITSSTDDVEVKINREPNQNEEANAVPIAYPWAFQVGTGIGRGLLTGAKATATAGALAVALVLMPTSAEAPGIKFGNQTATPPPYILKSNPTQDKMLTPGEIKRLEDGGVDVHELKGNKKTGQKDLYKKPNGDILIKPKGGGKMEGEETGYNIKDF
ncbi:hypothetical protein BLX24_03950 [Arsenicibacter rosenii]|uniref:Uncharacterized protein n=1 Tax=Arsenicibacter rosenii TaxID=1750698 RepID=A0A1S2VR60_9BACT|nr:hypothetical protein BLX24_03950 [Arsenicibacter rosenii]